jgi:integrase
VSSGDRKSDTTPRYRKTRYASVYVRHERGCPAVLADGPRCRCAPSFRARHRRYGHSPTFKDVHEANGWLTDAKRGKLPEPTTTQRTHELTFRELAEQWLQSVEVGLVGTRRGKRRYAANTIRQYRVALYEHAFPMYGDRLAARLTIVDWQDYIGALRAKGLRTNSINNYVNPVRAIYAWACSPVRRLLPANATTGLELPPGDEVKRERVARPDEMRALIDVLPADDRVIWALAAYEGMRSKEIDLLDWRDIDWKQGGIYVPDSKSAAGQRWIPLVKPAAMALCAHHDRHGRPTSGRVVVGSIRAAKERALGRLETSRSGRKRRVPGIWERNGLRPIGLHECRHTYNSWLHAAGVPLKVQAQVVGHEDETLSLKRYTHIMDGQVREAGVSLDAWLGAIGEGVS